MGLFELFHLESVVVVKRLMQQNSSHLVHSEIIEPAPATKFLIFPVLPVYKLRTCLPILLITCGQRSIGLIKK
jgi:hypothetical protein